MATYFAGAASIRVPAAATMAVNESGNRIASVESRETSDDQMLD
jgi:hypothetical protein